MTNDELINLFKKYLNRLPEATEIFNHVHKNYKQFEFEISTCVEKITLDKIRSQQNSKRNVAILLSGHVREMSILHNIEELVKNYNVDFFVFSWDNVGMKGNETDLEDTCDEKLIREKINQLPNVKAIKIENNKEYIKKNTPIRKNIKYFNFSSPEIFMKSQLYSVNSSFKLLEDYIKKTGKKYDMVIKCRFDCAFYEFTPDDGVFKDINEHDIIFVPDKEGGHAHHTGIMVDVNDSRSPTTTSCPTCNSMYYTYDLKQVHIYEHSSVICDIFAYGSLKSMKKYCSLYNHYDKINAEFIDSNLESCKKHNIKYIRKDNSYSLYSEDHIKNNDHKFLLKQHMNTMFYLKCSYPERMIQIFLKDYMLVESKKIKMTFHR